MDDIEKQIADSFAKVPEARWDNPPALHLTVMTKLFEDLREKGVVAIVPSSAVDTMNLGGLIGTTAMSGMAQQMMPPKAGVENRRSDERDAAG